MHLRQFAIVVLLSACGRIAAPGDDVPDMPPDASIDGSIDTPPQPPADLVVDWAQDIGTVGTDQVTAVTFTPTGTAIVLARFTGTLTLGETTFTSGSSGTATNALVARFDPGGHLVSAFAFGGAGTLGANAIVRDGSDNVYVGGSFAGIADFAGTQRTSVGSNDGFVARFSATGTLSWVTTFGNTNSDVVRGLAITPDNNLVFTGQFGGAITLGAIALDAGASLDAIVAKLGTGNGAAIWARQDGVATVNERGFQVASDANGSVYVAGRYDSGPTTIGSRNFTGAGAQDGYVEKLAGGDGAPQWAVTLGGLGNDTATSLVVRDDQSIAVTGSFTGSMTLPSGATLSGAGGVDAFVLGLSPLGTQSFAVAIGGPDNEGAQPVLARGAGNTTLLALSVGISGATIGDRMLGGTGGTDIALVGLDATGQPQWARGFGGAGDDRPLGVAAQNGIVLLGGGTASPSLQLGTTTLSNAGVEDGVLAQFDATHL